MPNWNQIKTAIQEQTGKQLDISQQQPIAGGCINQAMVIGAEPDRFFIKLNQPGLVDMFAAEFDGLNEIAASQSILVPRPICYGVAGDASYLVMTQMDFSPGNRGATTRFGEALAAMHQTTRPNYGWHRDNTIGSTPQPNSQNTDWVEFWRTQRLQFQLRLAQQNGASARLLDNGAELSDQLGTFVSSYPPAASCLHGDLWSGNWAFTPDGLPVIFDPAVYFGDRETDIAMTELFGSAGQEFYAAYNQITPLDGGYTTRRTLYNLYHILNHFNLFGGGYAAQADQMTQQLLSEIR